jgi:hypothetical protein
MRSWYKENGVELKMPRETRPSAAPGPVAIASTPSRPIDASSHAQLRDCDLYACLEDSDTLSASSKRTYRGGLRSLLLRTPSEGIANPLLHAISHYEETERIMQAADVALRTRLAWCAAVLSIFKHGVCAVAPELAAVHAQWSALCGRLSSDVEAVVKSSVMSAREQENWVPYKEWLDAEARLAREEYGSQRHLLVALSCRTPPARGGDYGLVEIVGPDSPLIADEGTTNVLLWNGVDQPSAIILKRHKTWKLKGALTKPLPPSMRALLKASLDSLPRTTLFVSELTRRRYASEASFLAWSLRAFHAVFGKNVTTNGARHAFLTALDTTKMSTAALEQLACEMGHSLAAQRAYFRLENGPPAAIRTADGELSLPMRTTALAPET